MRAISLLRAGALAKKKTIVRKQDQFLVRLPDGMRERIKAKADRADMSMNEAIVWCLEQFFPEPVTFEERLSELTRMVAILKNEADSNAAINSLIDEIHETLSDIADGRLETPRDFRGEVADKLMEWEEDKAEDWQSRHENPFDDRLYQSNVHVPNYGTDLDEKIPFDDDEDPFVDSTGPEKKT